MITDLEKWFQTEPPVWKILHDGLIDDIQYEYFQINEFQKLLIKHPHDNMGRIFKELIATCRRQLKYKVAEYISTYGDRPPPHRLRQEVLNGTYNYDRDNP